MLFGLKPIQEERQQIKDDLERARLGGFLPISGFQKEPVLNVGADRLRGAEGTPASEPPAADSEGPRGPLTRGSAAPS